MRTIKEFLDAWFTAEPWFSMIREGTGRPEWGAEYGKQYFIITWED